MSAKCGGTLLTTMALKGNNIVEKLCPLCLEKQFISEIFATFVREVTKLLNVI